MSGGEPSSIKRFVPGDAGCLSAHISHFLLCLGGAAVYQVLYRKYRPRSFADVVGQPQVTETLKNELARGRVAHAYLFTGSRGTGKTTCAKILAKAVNCLSPADGGPCGQCAVCRGLDEGSILDVVEIDAASHNGVESIRTLIEESNFTPAAAKYRVYIIDEVHMLSVQAFNALLKTLEEPPPHVVFILATTEVHKLLPTILSRCQRFDFRRIAPEQMAERLDYVAGQEGVRLDRDAALLIARLADGALRDALSLLDQCLGRDRHVTLETVYEAAGVAARGYLEELAQAVARREAAPALECIHRLHQESKDLSRLCQELAGYFRGLMLCKTMRDPGALLQSSPEEREQMERLALSMTLPDILHGLDAFEDTLNKMRFGSQRTQLEIAFVRLCSPELDSAPEALLRRLEALEQGAGPLVRPAPAPAEPPVPPPSPEPEIPGLDALDDEPAPRPQPAPKPQPAPPPQPPAPEPAPAPPAKNAPDIGALSAGAQRFLSWPEILQVIKGGAKSVAMAFEGSAAYVNGDYLLIDAPDIAFELLKKHEQRNRLRQAVLQVTGRVYKLGPYRKPAEQKEADPMEELARRARELGVPVEERRDEEAPPE